MKNATDVEGLNVRTALGIVTLSMSLILAGCCKESAGIEHKQARLQAMAEANAQRRSSIASRMEQNRQELNAETDHVQNSSQLIAADMAAIADAQMKMQEMVQRNNQYLANRPTVIEQCRQNLHIEVHDVQTDAQAMAGQ